MDDRHVRALDRAHALAEEWSGDQSPITRAKAAELLMEVLQLDGWTVSEPRLALRAVPDPEPLSARLRPVPAVKAPEPRCGAPRPLWATRGTRTPPRVRDTLNGPRAPAQPLQLPPCSSPSPP
ncbi:hypothetical protein [Streptomyces sp. NPDC097640]|uniref:hypothetical protein n=1 Tax=Streptomyces sp. NPDC097640 TaxID=3157229 RepID=UPI003322BD32